MRRMRRNSSEEDGIDISPLIDGVYLADFLHGIDHLCEGCSTQLQRPSAQSAEAADTKSVRISIDRQGAVYLGEEAIRLWMLQSRVREQLCILSV